MWRHVGIKVLWEAAKGSKSEGTIVWESLAIFGHLDPQHTCKQRRRNTLGTDEEASKQRKLLTA